MSANTPLDLLALDTAARERGAHEVSSFIVEAPAGAGKTELLTQRYLRLLATVKEPEEIIAITFTNKAAAEMRARILGSLALKDSDELPAHKRTTLALASAALARDAEYGWQLLQNPARLRITTIDALSASLARQMPYFSRFGAQPAIAEDPELHYQAAAQRTLALLEAEGEEGRTLVDALRYFSNDTDRLKKLMVAMLARRDQWLAHLDAAEQHEGTAIRALIVSDLNRAAQGIDTALAFGDAMPQLMAVARYAAGNLLAAGSDSPITRLAEWTQPLGAGSTRHKTTVIPAQAGIQSSTQPLDSRRSLPSTPIGGENDGRGRGDDEAGGGHVDATNDDILDQLDRWRGLAALLLTNSGTLRKRFDKNMGLPAEKEAKPHKDVLAACIDALTQTPGAEAALARLQEVPAPQLDAEEARIVAVFARLLKLASAQLWMVFQQQREVDFIEIAQRALTALGELDAPSSLQLKLDYRISHLLVDEFQDTSPAQIALLEHLTAGWQHDDGRTLFVVGDPMQSIYRFRKADVGLFLQARESGIGGIALESLRLNRNNRSHPEVVSWINATFPAVFPPADNPQSGAVKFAPSVATKSADVTAGVFMHPVLTSTDVDSTDVADIDEAQQIIVILRRTRATDPQSSIAILVRARPHLQALLTEMQRSAPELRYQAVEIEALEQRQVVQDLLALTRALHHRADRVNWLAILRAPWCGLTLADLHALAGDDHVSTVWALLHDEARLSRLSNDGLQRLHHLRSVLAEALAQQGRQRTRRWVEAAWRMLGGEACLHSAAERSDADAYFGLLEKLDASGGFTLEALDSEIPRLYAAPDPNADQGGSAAIQIMTVHKSKGLEFDIVILPGLHRAARNGDNSLLLWEEFVDDHGDEHLVIAPTRPRRSATAKTDAPSAYDYLRTLDAERESNEGSRVLYVAATRAIRALHLVGAATIDDRHSRGASPRMPESGSGNPGVSEIKPPRKGSPLAALWPAVEADFNTALDKSRHSRANDNPENPRHSREGGNPEVSAFAANSLSEFIPKLTRLATPAIPAYLQLDILPTEAHDQNSVPAAPVEAQETDVEINRALLADIGTLAHRTLELIALDGLDQWNVERINASQPAYQRWLQGRGHAAALLDDAATQVQEAVCNAITSDVGRWILGPHYDAGNELALTSQRDGAVQANVIDRTFIDNGVRWIVDYKTARLGASPTEASFVATAETFRSQLERYAALFVGAGMPIRIAIFFILHGRLVELPLVAN